MKVIQFIGTRPQIIKLIPDLGDWYWTGQHYDNVLFKDLLKDLKIKNPKKNLKSIILEDIIRECSVIIKEEKPDIVVVYGDCTTTLAATMAASKFKVKIAHIEAGIRNFNDDSQEERNRRMIDSISDYLFCTTQKAYDNLVGYKGEKYLVGDIMYERFLQHHNPNGKTLLTFHREENLVFDRIMWIFNKVRKYKKVIFFCHPHTRKVLEKLNISLPLNIKIMDSLPYTEMLRFLGKCNTVFTDSGGLIREAYWSGCNVVPLIETAHKEIFSFGDGMVSQKIKEILLK